MGTKRLHKPNEKILRTCSTYSHIIRFFLGLISSGFRKNPVPHSISSGLPNYFSPGLKFDAFVYLVDTPTSNWDTITQLEPIWSLYDKKYLVESFKRYETYNFSFPVSSKILKDEQDLYLMTVIIPHSAYQIKESSPKFSKLHTEMMDTLILTQTSLITMIEPLLIPEISILIGAGEEASVEKIEDVDVEDQLVKQKHFKSKIDIGLLYDEDPHPVNGSKFAFESKLPTSERNVYFPILFHSEFWIVERDFILLKDVQEDVPLNLTLSFKVYPVWLWAIQEQFDAVSSNPALVHTRTDFYMLKRILLDTNPVFLVFSFVFILLHSVFSFFAFKNDMQFWYRNESMVGLSAFSLAINLVCQVIIYLYLIESKGASWIIFFELTISLAITLWKLSRAVNISFLSNFPFIRIVSAQEYVESKTKEYDQVAIKWMSIFLLPCAFGYAVYALFKYRYRSWYSYCISVLAGVVYTFGFIMMTPQLYINYKLKSVDHLPWRALMYKSLNTFVDDVASFLIDMPWIHRISCFRDDIIFVVYIYQRWIYKVDKTCPSEWVERDISQPLPPVTTPAKILPPTPENEIPNTELALDAKESSTVLRRGKEDTSEATETARSTAFDKSAAQ
ncbi:cleft lip and palate transmembrane protein 1 (clptm1) protein [Cardiosporidium cionae]|uniref:Cleft lip and palate transmembrane protein 1 (Clptm1) protein n=1 Tax=Cardiosporidium cionae TaxID=476202 RepID=A0ABQ7JC44_9APIC|nr:cleft lip and palate transmembrane protein 1 (clptm1) protein [Cardiosporidium cionae]|eukprot:KAF8821546.1 cleft lip and palate transmembrane protein 1 (clptm1) protein [Cardiosporidium cionae]